jgi:hypothetical protein
VRCAGADTTSGGWKASESAAKEKVTDEIS